MVEIIDSDAKFGSSVKIYPENASSWAILAVVKPILVLIQACSVETKIEKIEKCYGNNLLNFFFAVGCAEKIFQEKNCKNSKKKLDTIFWTFFEHFRLKISRFALKWDETQLKWLMEDGFGGKLSRWIRIWHQNRWLQELYKKI